MLVATIIWRRNKQVTVYYWDNNIGKQVALPRKETEHLDGLPRDIVLKWKHDWEKSHGKIKARSNRIHLKEKDVLSTLWRQYQLHREKIKNRRTSTAEKETGEFETYIVPFFVKEHQKKDPADWHALIPAFHNWLFQKSLSDSTVKKILGTLERFGKYLMFQRHMIFPFVIQAPSSKNNKVTPLKVERTPEDIFKYVKNLTKEDYSKVDLRLAVLIGYFAALGPGELFALEKKDFLTGDIAQRETKTLTGFRERGLGSRLSVVIWKTLSAKGSNKLEASTKNETRKSVVNIWHGEAAKLIGKILSERTPGRLFPLSYSHMGKIWRQRIQPYLKTTPHDLRRASALYLGREFKLNPMLLQEHMRHSEIETTMLYTRRPATPTLPSEDKQNFDDIG